MLSAGGLAQGGEGAGSCADAAPQHGWMFGWWLSSFSSAPAGGAETTGTRAALPLTRHAPWGTCGVRPMRAPRSTVTIMQDC